MARLSRIEKIRRATAPKASPVVLSKMDDLASRICGGPIGPSQRAFIFSNERRLWFTGPVGVGKTEALIASIMCPAILYPGSRWFIGRHVYWTLEETTQKKFFAAVDRLGPDMVVDRQVGPPYKVWLASAVEGGEPAEIVFHSLDNLEKLGSTEFNGIGVDEANELPSEIPHVLDARLRWKMPWQKKPEGPYILRFASNPVRRSHWLHIEFCGEADCKPTPWGRKIRAHRDENKHNLPAGYYESISQNMTAEARIRFIEGDCGPDINGDPVFPDFATNLHSMDLKFEHGVPLLRGWDFGRQRPAVVFSQYLPNGWHNRLDMMMGENVLLTTFLERVLNYTGMAFPHAQEVMDFCDPHGDQKREMSDKSPMDLLRGAGLQPRFKDIRLDVALEWMGQELIRLIERRPQAAFDRVKCAVMVEGYAGGYTWPERRVGRTMKDKPLADGYYEHPMDGDRYTVVGIRQGWAGNQRKATARVLRKIRNPVTGY
jgi:hypothetical protein